jgi:hypothetical protein
VSTSEWYRQFRREARAGRSPTYERLGLAVADDLRLIGLLNRLPTPKRQPNLLFAATRYLGGPVGEPDVFRRWTLRHWTELETVMRARRTQTNEPARCAALLPVLAGLPQPLALLEVGASAGLCLYPDRYHYRYREHAVGPTTSGVRIECAVRGGVPLPDRVPTVVWRAGLDLNPLNVADPDDMRWLDALVWPEHEHRRANLRAAAEVVRADPPRLVRGDLVADLPALAAEAPPEATLVVFHSAVLSYVPVYDRVRFIDLVRGLQARWISNESHDVVPDIVVPAHPDGREPPETSEPSLVAVDGRAVAFAGLHGQSLVWVASAGAPPAEES